MSDAPLYESLLHHAFEPPPAKIRASASVVPWRRRGGRMEVYWVRRSPTMRFMGGWWAFPGGGISRADASIPVRGEPEGASSTGATFPAPGLDEGELERLGPDLVPGLLAGALRELFEETGLLLAQPTAGAGAAITGLEGGRRRLLEKELSFADLLADRGLGLDASGLVFAGRWLTPPFVPMRFDNRFFLLGWPGDEPVQPCLEGRELDRGEWVEPEAALERWRAGEVMAAPPILHILKVLGEDGPEAGLGRLRHPSETCLGPMRKVEFRPGIVLLPLETPTLPPATHTNAFLLGRRPAVVVDPSTPLPHEQERLLAALGAAREQDHELSAIWITHHHPDHVGAVEVVREAFGLEVLAHPDTARLLEPRGIRVDRHLEGGERIVLGGDPPLPIRVLHTPGHARGHLAFFDERSRTLVSGDLVSNLSTMVIDPPDGDMDEYLRSLERVTALEPSCLFPSHGPVILEPEKVLDDTRRHRLEREAAVLAAHRAGKTTPAAMVSEVYADTPPFLHPVAQRQILAHLARLEKLGKI